MNTEKAKELIATRFPAWCYLSGKPRKVLIDEVFDGEHGKPLAAFTVIYRGQLDCDVATMAYIHETRAGCLEHHESVKCPYCGETAKLVGGSVIYPHRPDLKKKKFWQCAPCDAYVGCHPRTDTPLGGLANLRTREARKQAHAAFDPIWRNKEMTRTQAYKWLSKQIGCNFKDCHIGQFGPAKCFQVVKVCKARDIEQLTDLTD